MQNDNHSLFPGDPVSVHMEQSAVNQARDLLRLGDLDGARRIAEEEIQRTDDAANTTDLWRLRFVRAQVLSMRGHSEEALQYLESLAPPDSHDLESRAELSRCRGAYSGYLGRYETSQRLLGEAEIMARDAGLLSLLGDTYLSEAFIFFSPKGLRFFRSPVPFGTRSLGEGWRLVSARTRALGHRQEPHDPGTLQRGNALAGGVPQDF